MRLVYHAEGVLCPVTFLMHLAGATESEGGCGKPCVVVAGGREPPHWEAYPGHQFLHTVGMLPCCRYGGCWRSRTLPLGDGDEKDNPENLCLDVVGNLPRCMDRITPKRVVEAIEGYYQGGRLNWPNKTLESLMQKRRKHFQPAGPTDLTDTELDPATAPERTDEFLATLLPDAADYAGQGIVICGGGVKHFTTAWVTVNRLRDLGTRLPIELWHLGPGELDDAMRRLVEHLGVQCVDAWQVRERHPVRRLAGWELKAFALLHSSFREVLLLDADNVPVRKPDALFEDEEFRRTGAVFWPDFGRLDRHRSIWRICGVAYRDEPEFESGQILVDKGRCWTALHLALWYNEHSDFFYQHVHGDKETFHMAFLKTETPYAMPAYPIEALPGTMCQHDFQGRRLFQHRNLARFDFHNENPSIPGFEGEEHCFRHLAELRRLWSGHVERNGTSEGRDSSYETVMTELTGTTFEYHRVGYDRRPMTFRNDGTIGQGAARLEAYWHLVRDADRYFLEIGSRRDVTCRLQRGRNGTWKGHWLHYEQMPVELAPGVMCKSQELTF